MSGGAGVPSFNPTFILPNSQRKGGLDASLQRIENQRYVRMGKTPGSYANGPEPTSGEGAPRRCFLNKNLPADVQAKTSDGLVDGNVLDIPTAYDVVLRSARLFGSQNGLGERELIKIHTEEKEVTKMVKGQEKKEMKKWQYFEMSDYKYRSYRQFLDDVHTVGSGLAALGLSKETMFNVYSKTW